MAMAIAEDIIDLIIMDADAAEAAVDSVELLEECLVDAAGAAEEDFITERIMHRGVVTAVKEITAVEGGIIIGRRTIRTQSKHS